MGNVVRSLGEVGGGQLEEGMIKIIVHMHETDK